MSDSLQPQGLQCTRILCLPLSKFAQINVHLVWWCYLSYPLTPLSPFAFSLYQHQGLFQWVSSASGCQSIGASASETVFPVKIQGWFPFGLTGLISLQSKGLSSTSVSKHQFFGIQPFFLKVQLSHLYMTTVKTIALAIRTFVSKVRSLLINTLSRFVKAFLPRSKRLLISWLQLPCTVILEPQKRKSVTASSFPLLFAIKS